MTDHNTITLYGTAMGTGYAYEHRAGRGASAAREPRARRAAPARAGACSYPSLAASTLTVAACRCLRTVEVGLVAHPQHKIQLYHFTGLIRGE